MKRLLITLEYPPDVGGVAEYYRGLVDSLPSGSVRVLTPRDTRFFVRWFWPHWLPLVWNMWRLIRRERPEELWVGQILPIGTVAFFLKRFAIRDLRYTIFCHGMDIFMCQRSRWKKFLARRILASADRVVANSNFTKQEIMKFGVPEEKIRVVYPCPRLTSQMSNVTCQMLRERYELLGKKILLTAARLVRRKGVDLVIEALRDVARQIPNLVYIVLGDGPERRALEVKCQVSGVRCLFVGAVTDLAERAAWFSLADVYISTPRTLPYDVESFGLVYIEANMFGKPAIGSRSGGVPEAVVDGETGVLVPEEDTHAIATAITSLLRDDGMRKRLGENGRMRVYHEFQWHVQKTKLSFEFKA